MIRAVSRARLYSGGRQSLCTGLGRRCLDGRVRDVNNEEIYDDYAQLDEKYESPRYPIVLAHGLFGFSELRLRLRLRLAPRLLRLLRLLPAIEYWYGIKDALQASGARVLVTSVSPSSSIAVRAAELAESIVAAEQRQGINDDSSSSSSDDDKVSGSPPPPPPETLVVNIIAHSMGGLDARYMISRLQTSAARKIRVASLTTIATPHRGSPVADLLFAAAATDGDSDTSSSSSSNPSSRSNHHHHQYHYYYQILPRLVSRLGLGTAEALAQLTTRYMGETFNPATPDDPATRYFSYGADLGALPPLLGVFRKPYQIVRDREGPNDGLVSVHSSRWGEYQGTLMSVSHLDLINWSNRMRWAVREMMGMKRTFNAVAFYLGIADMLAKQGL